MVFVAVNLRQDSTQFYQVFIWQFSFNFEFEFQFKLLSHRVGAKDTQSSKTWFYVSKTLSLEAIVINLLNFTKLQLRVTAFDTAVQSQVAEALVSVNMIRNENPPIFINEPYQTTLTESESLGSSIYKISATDADNVSPTMIERGDSFCKKPPRQKPHNLINLSNVYR